MPRRDGGRAGVSRVFRPEGPSSSRSRSRFNTLRHSGSWARMFVSSIAFSAEVWLGNISNFTKTTCMRQQKLVLQIQNTARVPLTGNTEIRQNVGGERSVPFLSLQSDMGHDSSGPFVPLMAGLGRASAASSPRNPLRPENSKWSSCRRRL